MGKLGPFAETAEQTNKESRECHRIAKEAEEIRLSLLDFAKLRKEQRKGK